jgi:hypothetical protein
MKRRAVVLLAALALGGCSLPLPSDVRPVGEVPAEQRQSGPLQVIPPRPKADATPVEAVLGFLGAQASSEGGHAIARQFLSVAESSRWRDDGNVQVYDPDSLELQQGATSSTSTAVVRVVSRVSGSLRADGSYAAQPDVSVAEDYHLIRVQGRWVLDQVPEGLRLTAADLQRAFVPQPVYYLAPGTQRPHVVADQVFLPIATDLARTLVTRLLQPPSQALAGSVATAVPVGTQLRQLVTSSSGVVTVDLTGMRVRPSGERAQELSAQLVWTLRSLGASFRGLRLRVDGEHLPVPDEGEVQDSAAWEEFDPEGLGPAPPYFFTAARRLRASVELPSNPATAGEVGFGRTVPVDAVAVTPDRALVALIEDSGSGPDTVRVGPLRGTAFPVVARSVGLTSPSWGSGAQGLWLLRGGRELVRVQNGLRPVPVVGLPAGRVTSLAVSRDGVRVALVVAGRLYAGRVELVSGTPRVVGLTLVLPALHGASRVSWASSTELVVIGVLTRAVQVVRVSVDGSAVETLNTAGLVPQEVAASPAEVVLGTPSGLFLSAGGAFRQVQPDAASAPVFPG